MGPGKARNVHVNVRLDGLSSVPVLLPIWVMAYRYEDKVYRFLMNGQSGRFTGQAPFSWAKLIQILIVVLVVVLGCVGVVAVCSGFATAVAHAARLPTPDVAGVWDFSTRCAGSTLMSFAPFRVL